MSKKPKKNTYKQKIIVIVGPTASGKSDLAIYLAKKYNGEVISADSRQVYKGLDIGTGKITVKEMDGIPHHLLNVASPKRVYSVARFKKDALKSIRYIVQQKKLPIIAGGTGFYIDTLLGKIDIPEVKANPKLRKILSKKSVSYLYSLLKKLDPRRAKEIDKNNPVRLIRAIEIAKTLGKVPTFKKKESPFDVLTIGIKIPDEVLKKNIKSRLLKRVEQGMINEVKKLYENGLPFKRMEVLGLEYRYVALYLQGKIKKEEMLRKLETEIWRYAKRQKRWFKRDKEIKWLYKKNLKKIDGLLKHFLENIG